MLRTAENSSHFSTSDSKARSTRRSPANHAIVVGRVGGLAVAFGIGTAVALGTAALACADSDRSDSPNLSAPSAGSSPAVRRDALERHSAAAIPAGQSTLDTHAELTVSGTPAITSVADAFTVTHSPSAAAVVSGEARSASSMQATIGSALLGWRTRRDLQQSAISGSTPSQPTLSQPALSQSAPSAAPAATPVQAAAVTTTATPPFFAAADWLWKPIPANPTIAANNATWVSYLSAPGTKHIANLVAYGVTLIPVAAVSSSTPRYRVNLSQTGSWGPYPFGTKTVPLPLGTKVPPGSDGHVAVLDPTTGMAFGIWQAKYNSKKKTWSGTWGGMTPLNGNGVDVSGSSTGSGIARYAGVVTAAEFSAAVAANTGINHALVFSTDIAGPGFVGPAAKSDGWNNAGVATPIPEGYRIQLDPTINVDAIPGITPAERVIAKTLQTYGAYVIDNGGARAAFLFEMVPGATSSNPGAAWTSAGLAWDYYDMAKIPWTKLRVLAP